MDRKTILVLIACFALMLCMRVLIDKAFPPTPIPVSTNQVATNTTVTGTNPAVTQAIGSGQPPTVTPPGVAPKMVVLSEVPEELLVVSNDNARYTFTSRGGGLQQVELLHYPETVSVGRKKIRHTNALASLNAPSSPPVLAILGDPALQDDGVFKLTPISNGVRAEKTLSNGLILTKEFVLETNYLVSVSVRMKNGSQQPLTLPPQEWFAGTATPMGPQDSGYDQTIMWFDGKDSHSPGLVSHFNPSTNKMLFFSRIPEKEYRGGSNNVVWVTAQNQYFALATMPKQPAFGLVARIVDLPRPGRDVLESVPGVIREPKGLEAALSYPALTLDAGQTVTNEFNVFAGPKEYQTVVEVSSQLRNEISLIVGFGWFGAVSKALLIAMNWIHNTLSLSYGWVIIVITVIIRLVFWPLTQASTRSMKRMQALQPQLKALQEKYKGEPQKLSQKQWEFYRKNKVNPLGGCLPMLLQLPVFFGFFGMLRSAIELRGAPFLWMHDLSQPDTILVLPFLGYNLPLNPMPLIMGASQFWQATLMPPSPGMDPAQQKMMKYLPLIMVVFLYNYSSGLALYWTVSNLLTILQTKLTKTPPGQPGAPVPVPVAKVAPVAPQKKKKQ